jgi:hypothetical protein
MKVTTHPTLKAPRPTTGGPRHPNDEVRPMSIVTPRRMRTFNGLSCLFWLAMTPVAFATGLADSVDFVSFLSLWALVAASLSGFVASRVEVAQEETDIASDVVSKMLTDTTVDPQPPPVPTP